MKGFDRREFLKLLGCALVVTPFSTKLLEHVTSAVTQSPISQSDQSIQDISDPKDLRLVEQNTRMPVSDYEPKWAMILDVGSCIGCRRCMHACKLENNIAERIYPLWIEVFESNSNVPLTEYSHNSWTQKYTDSPRQGKRYLPIQCMHCENPPCVKVCPVGARYKSEDGIVDTRYDRCIGCRYCVTACPYSVNRFNWFKPEFDPERKINPEVPVRPIGVVEKCNFCAHRIRKGLYPRCVEVCPLKVRRFGNLNDPESDVSKIIASFPSKRILEELGTMPSIYYTTYGVKWDDEGNKI